MDGVRACPALFISAPGSSHGKTTVTAALARHHRNHGRTVRVFKAGPDFLDPTIHARASGHPAYQLDLWLAGADECRRLVWQAAADADLILIEGVMGLFDGAPSSADLAQLLGVPVLAVIDATGAAQTLGAIAAGLAHYRSGLAFAGVLANEVASARHEDMIREGMPDGIHYLGAIRRDAQLALPARHLGLVQASELDDLDARLDAAAAAIGATALAQLPPPVVFAPVPQPAVPRLLEGVRIGVARDAAFSFIYPANLDLLRALGATLAFFSPLADHALPPVDSIWLPGGYPELHLRQLADNHAMKAALHAHCDQGKAVHAECGGMLYLMESLTDQLGQNARMAGILAGHAVLQKKLQGLGYQSITLDGGTLRCHTFHHSLVDTTMAAAATGERLHNTSAGEKMFRRRGVTASYLHGYFASAPALVAQWLMKR